MPVSEQQAWDIVRKGPAYFGFYYGEIRYGYLHLNRVENRWYFVEKFNEFKEANFSTEVLVTQKLGRPIDLQMIRLIESPKKAAWESSPSIELSSWDESILVVLGAGASFDFTADEITHRPPMVRDLFSDAHSELRKLYGEVDSIFQSARGQFDLETFLQRRWDMLQDSYNPVLLRKLVGVQYYLHHLFFRLSILCRNAEHNNYRSLVQHMHDYAATKQGRVRFIVVSFNYDTLFEDAVRKELNWEYNQVSDYTDPDRYIQVYKVHGSANWARAHPLFSSTINHDHYFSELAKQVTDDLADLSETLGHFNSDTIVLSDEEKKFMGQAFMDPELNHWENLIPDIFLRKAASGANSGKRSELFGARAFWPEILIPYSRKDSFILPQTTIAQLKTFLKKADSVLCIGWKGNELLFRDILAEKERKYLWVTKGEDGHSEIKSGECQDVSTDMKFYRRGFSTFMSNVNANMDNLFKELHTLPGIEWFA
jgi:hypothetical protein